MADRPMVYHVYDAAADQHFVWAEDVDEREACSVYFYSIEGCPARGDHEPHDEIVEVMQALRRIYVADLEGT